MFLYKLWVDTSHVNYNLYFPVFAIFVIFLRVMMAWQPLLIEYGFFYYPIGGYLHTKFEIFNMK